MRLDHWLGLDYGLRLRLRARTGARNDGAWLRLSNGLLASRLGTLASLRLRLRLDYRLNYGWLRLNYGLRLDLQFPVR